MKRTYETPIIEKIEFDYTETVAACSPSEYEGAHIHQTYGQWVYRDANVGYQVCESSITPEATCGFNGKHTANVGHFC